MRCAAVFSSLLLCAVLTEDVAASPWGRPYGETLVISRVRYYSGIRDISGDVSGSGQYRFRSVSNDVYIEYGLAPGVTVTGKMVQNRVSYFYDSGMETLSAVSETGAHVQYRFSRQGNGAAAVRFGVSGRVADSGDVYAGRGYRPDAELSLLYARSFGRFPFKAFACIDAGYRGRFSGGRHMAAIDATAGIEAGKRWLFLLQGNVTRPFLRERGGSTLSDSGFQLRPSLVVDAGRTQSGNWSVQIGYMKDISLKGRASVPSRVFFGIWRRF